MSWLFGPDTPLEWFAMVAIYTCVGFLITVGLLTPLLALAVREWRAVRDLLNPETPGGIAELATKQEVQELKRKAQDSNLQTPGGPRA